MILFFKFYLKKIYLDLCFGHMARGILAPWPGIELMTPAMEAWSLNYWTAREVPNKLNLNWQAQEFLDAYTRRW